MGGSDEEEIEIELEGADQMDWHAAKIVAACHSLVIRSVDGKLPVEIDPEDTSADQRGEAATKSESAELGAAASGSGLDGDPMEKAAFETLGWVLEQDPATGLTVMRGPEAARQRMAMLQQGSGATHLREDGNAD